MLNSISVNSSASTFVHVTGMSAVGRCVRHARACAWLVAIVLVATLAPAFAQVTLTASTPLALRSRTRKQFQLQPHRRFLPLRRYCHALLHSHPSPDHRHARVHAESADGHRARQAHPEHHHLGYDPSSAVHYDDNCGRSHEHGYSAREPIRPRSHSRLHSHSDDSRNSEQRSRRKRRHSRHHSNFAQRIFGSGNAVVQRSLPRGGIRSHVFLSLRGFGAE